MQITAIKQTFISVRVYGHNFTYIVKKCTSRTAGMSLLIIDLSDVNGQPMECNVFSSEYGSFE